MGKTPTFAVSMEKGGVGKTTLSLNMYACFAKYLKCCLIELDPQQGAPGQLGFEPGHRFKPSMADVLDPQIDIPLEDAIHRVTRGGIEFHFVPGGLSLEFVGPKLVNEFPETHRHRLLEKITTAKWDYDLCIIDCPPSLGVLTQLGIVASGMLVIPVHAEYASLHALAQYHELLRQIDLAQGKRTYNVRYAITKYDVRVKKAREAVTKLRDSLGELVFDTVIHAYPKMMEAPDAGVPWVTLMPTHPGAKAYEKLVREIVPELDRYGLERNGTEVAANDDSVDESFAKEVV